MNLQHCLFHYQMVYKCSIGILRHLYNRIYRFPQSSRLIQFLKLFPLIGPNNILGLHWCSYKYLLFPLSLLKLIFSSLTKLHFWVGYKLPRLSPSSVGIWFLTPVTDPRSFILLYLRTDIVSLFVGTTVKLQVTL